MLPFLLIFTSFTLLPSFLKNPKFQVDYVSGMNNNNNNLNLNWEQIQILF